MIFARLGKELDGADDGVVADGPGDAVIGQGAIELVGLAAQVRGRMGVGVGKHRVALAGKRPWPACGDRPTTRSPRHECSARNPRSTPPGCRIPSANPAAENQGVQMCAGMISTAVVDVQDLGADVACRGAQDGAAVRGQVEAPAQGGIDLFHAGQRRRQEQEVHLAHAPALLVDQGDLRAQDEMRFLPALLPGGVPCGTAVCQRVEAGGGLAERGFHVAEPEGMGEVAAAHDADALDPGPAGQLGQVQRRGRAARIAGMDVEIGVKTHSADFLEFPEYPSFR